LMPTTIYFLIGLLVFWGIVLLLREKLVEMGFTVYPFLLLWRKGTRAEWFPKLARSRAFKVFEVISLGISIGAMLGGISLIILSLLGSLNPAKPSTVRLEPIIPGVTVGLDQAPYILIAIGVSVLIHELMHAISATSNRISVKSGGIILLGFFPGAFVEPEEREFSNSSTLSKLKVVSVGIAINLILAGVFFPIVSYVPPMLSQGVLVEGVLPHSAAYNSSMEPGYVIQEINGIRVTTPDQLHRVLENFTTYLIEVKTPSGSELFNVTSPNHFLGVYITYYIPSYYLPLISTALWMFIVNLSLGLLNGAPLIITDGGKVLNELMKKIPHGERISLILQGALVLLLVFSISLSFTPQ